MQQEEAKPVCLSDADRLTLAHDLADLFKAHWKLADCIGISIAADKDQLPQRYVSEDAKTTMLEFAFGQSSAILEQLEGMKKRLGIDNQTIGEVIR